MAKQKCLFNSGFNCWRTPPPEGDIQCQCCLLSLIFTVQFTQTQLTEAMAAKYGIDVNQVHRESINSMQKLMQSNFPIKGSLEFICRWLALLYASKVGDTKLGTLMAEKLGVVNISKR